ncbi:glycosyltransferase family 2 protein [Hymenobacter sp. BT770]|uniref:glycosyltransferase family A protein n=1 Tax=Hymenobacter sp. BT770 TaxID=2886942 RepID=UPI001D0FEBC8|nr:glycosyltransferase family 2 protein [Hymenobacter sp. BT770]MCC3155058.1 glycosyltransferase family 2 protein [Hymenobacter sp. BT770]MDO3417003.1 glycosyltransferase family 2 protein [Hymenobacter sp. BT770]
MIDYKISYVVTTYNKLPYLKQVMERLVAARQPDEEIVVADGGSKDGTPAYLRGLFDAGLIQQYVSERDKGEAHGFNKCMLMARGELIKIITDDDAFCYPAIREAADFMLSRPEVDVLCANSGQLYINDLSIINLYAYSRNNYLKWYKDSTVTIMLGLPLIIRRSSLSLTGLFNTNAVLVDTEFTARITALDVNIGWSSAMLSVRIDNPDSNFNKYDAALRDEEAARVMYYYDKSFRNDPASILWQRIPLKEWLNKPVEWLKKPIRPAKDAIFRLLDIPLWKPEVIPAFPTDYNKDTVDDPIITAFQLADNCMANFNAAHATEFVFKTSTSDIVKVLPISQ